MSATLLPRVGAPKYYSDVSQSKTMGCRSTTGLSNFSRSGELSQVPSKLQIGDLRDGDVSSHLLSEVGQAYQFDEVLGKGSFGEVRRATCLETQQQYAIKTIQLQNEKVINNSEKELRVFAKLANPYIVRLHRVYRQEGCLHMVMDLCSGGNLMQYLETYWQHPERKLLRHFIVTSGAPLGLPHPEVGLRMWQILSAVAYMHHHRFVHRDIKPENIMLKDSTELSQLQLTDFGYSARFRKDAKMTRSVGTILYMAPEVIQGSYLEKCDIWSVGVVCHLLTFRTHPYLGDTEKDVTTNILSNEKVDVSEFADKIHPELNKFVGMLLTSDPDKRPAAMKVLDCNAWLRKHGIQKMNGCCTIS